MTVLTAPAHAGMRNAAAAGRLLNDIWLAVGGAAPLTGQVRFAGRGSLPSVFAVSDLAAASIGAAALALAEWLAQDGRPLPAVSVDRRLASMWFGWTLRPISWALPPVWDPIAGDYPTADGWIRLHTNAPHHLQSVLRVLGVPARKDAVVQAVAGWQADRLEAAIVAEHGCAAALRSQAEWALHEQGRAVAAEPLLQRQQWPAGSVRTGRIDPHRPLAGIRVLDLTRIIAGPVATRFLAAFGADVLRIDPPDWEEPAVAHEVTLGKRCARLDLKTPQGREMLERLLTGADVLVHGYRPDALEHLGLGAQLRQALNPSLVEVALSAYGWHGPWRLRRGFDGLVQMSSGIAAAGMQRLGRDRPTPLPVQALDHAAGYLLACAALRGLSERRQSGRAGRTCASLARVAALLSGEIADWDCLDPLAPETAQDVAPALEHTAWGAARRLRAPMAIEGVPPAWDYPALQLGAFPAQWRDG